jgi:hypothetical protein
MISYCNILYYFEALFLYGALHYSLLKALSIMVITEQEIRSLVVGAEAAAL